MVIKHNGPNWLGLFQALKEMPEENNPMMHECVESQARTRTLKNNTVVFATQCVQCGKHFRNIAKGKSAPPEEAYEEGRYERFWAEQQAARNDERQKKSSKWWEVYNDYLRSDEWRSKRQKALMQCGGICRGCGDRPPVEVHHLTYADVGDEFIFQLLPLCDDCHQKIHTEPEGVE